jgi:putative spermidine/putrescine transport system ATP-binding protein
VIAPPVLLLDEPLSNLDAKLREEMQFELRRIQRKVGTTTIMVTHDQAEALSISDRVVVMEAGRATQIDAPYRLYEHPKTEFISSFVGKTNLLPGRLSRNASGTAVELAQGQRLNVDAGEFADGASVTVCLRPEKLFFTEAANGTLAGRVEERFFLGSQWLYRISSELGELELSCANDGSAPVEEHAAVHLAWADDVARLVASRT